MDTPLLGKRVRDIVTGLEGVAISATLYLNGCVRYCVQPKGLDKDGKLFEADWVDVQQLYPTSETLVLDELPDKAKDKHKSGGPQKDPPRIMRNDIPPKW